MYEPHEVVDAFLMAPHDPVSLVADANGHADSETFEWLKGAPVPAPTIRTLVELVARGPAASRRGRANTLEATRWMYATLDRIEVGQLQQVRTQDLLDLVFCMWRHDLPRPQLDLVVKEIRRRVHARRDTKA